MVCLIFFIVKLKEFQQKLSLSRSVHNSHPFGDVEVKILFVTRKK